MVLMKRILPISSLKIEVSLFYNTVIVTPTNVAFKNTMKLILIVTCLLSIQFGTAQKIEDFKWLEGTWKRTNLTPGNAAYESWQITDHSLQGLGVRLSGADTVFIERLKIVATDEGASYIAEVDHNDSAIYFRITDFSETSFISENPAHDFPKNIVYQMKDSKLTVTISGNGKTIPFVFQKTD